MDNSYSFRDIVKVLKAMTLIIGFCSCTHGNTLFDPLRESGETTHPRPRTRYDLDAGWWLSLKPGFQTTNGIIGDKWSAVGTAEYRLRDAFSFPLDYHIWKSNVYEEKGGIPVTFGTVSLGLKVRGYIGDFNCSVQGSIGGGISLSPITMMYVVGSEYVILEKKLHLILEVRKNWYPEFDYFLLLGIGIKYPIAY